MNKQEQLGYIITTPIVELDISLITETFTEQEIQGIILQKFYGGNIFHIISELWDAILGIYNTLGTVVPIQNLSHLEPTRKKYMDIKVLWDLLKK